MGLFNKKIKAQQGTVKISGDYLICQGREGSSPLLHDDRVNIVQLEHIYLVLDDYGARSLSLLDNKDYTSIPISFTGFHEALKSYPKYMD